MSADPPPPEEDNDASTVAPPETHMEAGDTLPLKDDVTHMEAGDTVPLTEEDSLETIPTPPPEPMQPGETVHTPPPGEFWDPTDTEAPLTHIGRYEIVRELARGGMGVVYIARDTQLDREVALKVMLSGARAGPGERERFSIEARAAARLVHPNIVAILDVGEERGQRYFAMEFIKGESLQKRITRMGKLDPRVAAGFAKTLAEALYYAHSQAILHRDMKPDNVLINEAGEPLITDFGIAKDIKSDAPGLTKTGQLMGTPGYMPPEQANGELDRIDRRADVYALGGTLYCMLTGRPPFVGTTTMNTVAKVLNEDPVPPTKLAPTVDRDIETICLKALEKEPEHRYVSAEALARDLGRYLANETIAARPPTPAERMQKWVRRNRTSARLLAVSVGVSVLLGLGGTAWFVHRLQAETTRAQQAEKEAKLKRDEAEAAHEIAVAQTQEAERQRARADERALEAERSKREIERRNQEIVRRIGDAQDEKARGLAERGEWAPAAALLAEALSSADRPVRRGRLLEALANLPTGRDLVGHKNTVSKLAFSPDSTRLASGSSDDSVLVWTLGSDAPPVRLLLEATPRTLVWSPDGTRLALAFQTKVQVWDASSGSRLAELDHYNAAVCAWSPAGDLLACGGTHPSVTLWETQGYENVARHGDHRRSRVRTLAFSADGGLLASGSANGNVLVRTAKGGWSGSELPGAHTSEITALEFGPKIAVLATGSIDQTIKLWDPKGLELLTTLTGHGSPVTDLRWTSDGLGLVSASRNGNARVWRHVDAAVFRQEALLGGHHAIKRSPLSDDGQRIATLGRERVRLWSRSGQPQGTIEHLHERGDQVSSAAFSGDGAHLALATRADPTVHLYDTSRAPFVALRWHDRELRSATWNADGSRIIVRDRPGRLVLWDAERAVPIARPQPLGEVPSLFVSGDGRFCVERLSFVGRLWNTSTGALMATWENVSRVSGRIGFAPDGSQIALPRARDSVLVCAGDGEQLRILEGTGDVLDLAYTPDSKRLATGGRDGKVRVWDAATGKELLALEGGGKGISHVQWSRDGQRLAAADLLGSVVIWEGASGGVLAKPGRAGDVLAWSVDGRLACGGRQAKRLTVFDDSGREQASVAFAGAQRIVWSRDGSRLAAIRGNGAAVLWDGKSPEAKALGEQCGDVAWSPTAPWLAFCAGNDVAISDANGAPRVLLPGHTATIRSLAWSPDGKRLVSASDDRAAIVWDTEIALQEPGSLRALTQERTGLQVDVLSVESAR